MIKTTNCAEFRKDDIFAFAARNNYFVKAKSPEIFTSDEEFGPKEVQEQKMRERHDMLEGASAA